MEASGRRGPRLVYAVGVADSSKLPQAAANVPTMSTPGGDFPVASSRYPEILTTALAAELLHVHVEYLRRMVREGRIPAHRFPGGREIRFHRDELIAWVKAQPGEDRSPSAADKADS